MVRILVSIISTGEGPNDTKGRALVRYCVADLGRAMLWCTCGVGEFWSLTLAERKRLLEVAIEEGRAINSGVVVQACTTAPGRGRKIWPLTS